MKRSEKIKEFRAKKGLTQEDLAKITGFTTGYISQIENEVRKPSLKFLDKLRDVFGPSANYIFYETLPDQAEHRLAEHQDEFIRAEIPMMIREPEFKYQVIPTAQKKLLDNVIEILNSDNEVMIEALKANIKAFIEAVQAKKRNDENKSKGSD